MPVACGDQRLVQRRGDHGDLGDPVFLTDEKEVRLATGARQQLRARPCQRPIVRRGHGMRIGPEPDDKRILRLHYRSAEASREDG